MVINMRFYLLTVIFIFLALGIGIFIGFIFDAQGILMSEREDLINKLEKRFDILELEKEKIRENMNEITSENSNYIEFIEIIFPYLVKDRLNSLNVSIIEINKENSYSEIINTIESAGGNVTSYITINADDFYNLEKVLVNNVTKDDNQLHKSKMLILLDTIINGKGGKNIKDLFVSNSIKTEGDFDQSIDYIILTSDGNKDKGIIEINMISEIIDYLNSKNVPIVGIERSDVLTSYIDIYKNKGISTIDNINSIIGKVSLIYTLEGHPGNYGIKSSAESLTAFPNQISNKGEFR